MLDNLIKSNLPKDDERTRSWFMVLNNPKEHIPECENMTPEEICDYCAEKWMNRNGDNASCAFAYCISADGLEHIHGIGENPNKVAFKVVKALYPGIHLEATKGTKKQAEDYIYKRGAFKEKGEKIIYTKVVGEIVATQGKRNDLDKIADMVASGMSLMQIQDELGCLYEKYEHIHDTKPYRRHCTLAIKLQALNLIYRLYELQKPGNQKWFPGFLFLREFGEYTKLSKTSAVPDKYLYFS